jgi:transcriptional regulator with XRE-family HTH domain
MNQIVGERIRSLRAEADISQEELAASMDISRPTLVKIEAGKRPLTIEEAEHLTNFFGISILDLLSDEQHVTVEVIKSKGGAVSEKRGGMRISVPQKKLDKFKEVLLYILGKVGAKPNVGETVLYKLLYFIDFNFYEQYEEQLIGATYIKNKYGPTPVEFKKVVEDMIEDGDLVRVVSQYFKYPQRKYVPNRVADLRFLNAREVKLIDGVLSELSNMSANEISAYSHNDVPWLSADDGQPIDYESVFYRSEEYSVREYEDEEAQ